MKRETDRFHLRGDERMDALWWFCAQTTSPSPTFTLQDWTFPSLEFVGVRPVFLRASFLRAFQEVIEWRRKKASEREVARHETIGRRQKGKLVDQIINSWIRIQDSHRISKEG